MFLLAKESTGLEELNDSSRVSVKSRGAQCGRTWLEIDSRVTSDDEKCRDALLEPGSCLEGRRLVEKQSTKKWLEIECASRLT